MMRMISIIIITIIGVNWRGMSPIPLIFSIAVHPINFTLGWCIAEDQRRCSGECEPSR